jgi:hypothetical protein
MEKFKVYKENFLCDRGGKIKESNNCKLWKGEN